MSVHADAKLDNVTGKLIEIWEKILDLKGIDGSQSFLQLGGNSLNAIVLELEMNKEFEVEIPMEMLFGDFTIRSLAEHIEKSHKTLYSHIEPAEAMEYYPASYGQQRVFSTDARRRGMGYNVPSVYFLKGRLNIGKLEAAYRTLVGRHESFRTSFHTIDDETVQMIHAHVDFVMEYAEMAGPVHADEIDGVIEQYIKPFDLAKAPLIRAVLVRLEPDSYLLIQDIHHILVDAISMKRLHQELFDLYAGKELPEPGIQYKDFTIWQNKLLGTPKLKEQERYWLRVFSGDIPSAHIPLDYPRPAKQSLAGGDFVFAELDDRLRHGVREMAAHSGLTTFMIMLSALYILTAKYADREDVVIGTPVAGRNHDQLLHVIGYFANLIALRNRPQGNKNGMDFLQEVKQSTVEALSNQDYPLELLNRKLGLKRESTTDPLYNMMFLCPDVASNKGDESFHIGPHLKAQFYEYCTHFCLYDIVFVVFDYGDRIRIRIEYGCELFKRETMERLAEHFIRVLEQMVFHPHVKLADIHISAR